MIGERRRALGDLERDAGLPISTFCDRHKDVNLAKSQAGFLTFVCRPFYVAAGRVLGDASSSAAVARLDANAKAWPEREEAEQGTATVLHA